MKKPSSRKSFRWIGAGVVAFAAMPLSALANTELPSQPAIVDLVAGAQIYEDNCAACHGDKLEGQPNWRVENEDGILPAPPHDEGGHTWHHGDALLFEYTKTGGKITLGKRGITDFKSGMPAFGEILSDQDIWDVLAFIKSTWSERVQELQAGRTEAEKIYGN